MKRLVLKKDRMEKLVTLISTIFFLKFFKGDFHQKACELCNTFLLKQLLKKDPFPNSEVRLKLLHLEIAAKAMFEKKKKKKYEVNEQRNAWQCHH